MRTRLVAALTLPLVSCGGSAPLALDSGAPTDAAMPRGWGEVELAEWNSGSNGGAALTAVFGQLEGVRGFACTARAIGDDCLAATCTVPPGSDATAATRATAGLITATGPDGGTVFDAPIDANQGYEWAYSDQPFFAPGASVEIRAAGAELGVAPFDATLVVPSPITVAMPYWAPGRMPPLLDIQRQSPLSVTWAGGGASDGVLVRLSPDRVGLDGPTVTVECVFPAAAGIGGVPTEALSAIPYGSLGYVAIYAANRTTVSVGAYDVTVLASSEEGYLPAGGPATFH